MTRDIKAKTAESVTNVVSIAASARLRASCWPYNEKVCLALINERGFTWYDGAASVTITWNFLFLAAPLRNASTVFECPVVIITSLEWIWSNAWAAILLALKEEGLGGYYITGGAH